MAAEVLGENLCFWNSIITNFEIEKDKEQDEVCRLNPFLSLLHLCHHLVFVFVLQIGLNKLRKARSVDSLC